MVPKFIRHLGANGKYENSISGSGSGVNASPVPDDGLSQFQSERINELKLHQSFEMDMEFMSKSNPNLISLGPGLPYPMDQFVTASGQLSSQEPTSPELHWPKSGQRGSLR